MSAHALVAFQEDTLQLALSDESQMVKETFERFFTAESTSARIRAAEPVGFDVGLWQELLALEVPFMRMSAEAGGGGMGLFDACLMMEQAGRHLAPAPLTEAIVAMRVLGEVGGEVAQRWIAQVREGKVLTMALHQARDGESQIVPGGAVAAGVLTFDGTELAIEIPAAPLAAPATLGGAALGLFEPGKARREVLASNADVARIWAAAIEEWKLLTASALTGLAQQSLTMAAAYACERTAFGQPIGANQGLAHPLADDVIDADGSRMMLWSTLKAVAEGKPGAGAAIAMTYWWAARTASTSVAHALHTFGGYGLTNEYDIQLYHRRAKAWALALGDPHEQLVLAGRRQVLGEVCALPDVGEIEIDFDPPSGGEAMAEETRAVFAGVLDPEKHWLHDHSFESHAWDVHQALGQAGLLFPDWPIEWGGRGADEDSARASKAVWRELGYAPPSASTTGMIGAAVLAFGSPELKAEVMHRFSRGEAIAALGYTEPSGGSDVFAAKTRAVRDGSDWVINGQKMFTSGADQAAYVFLIARTDPDAPKHRGITMFLVPLDSPGVEIHPVYTFMDERTNATFYTDVRIPDRYCIGEVNQGARVLSSALSKEQSGGGYHENLRKMADAVVDWAKTKTRAGKPMIEDPQVLARIARVHAHANISEALSGRVLGMRLAGLPDLAFGPAAKVFATESFIKDSADLLDLAAPDSLVRGKDGLGVVEMGYRHATATSIYGGTSEVLRSMVAEKRLGLPRSRA